MGGTAQVSSRAASGGRFSGNNPPWPFLLVLPSRTFQASAKLRNSSNRWPHDAAEGRVLLQLRGATGKPQTLLTFNPSSLLVGKGMVSDPHHCPTVKGQTCTQWVLKTFQGPSDMQKSRGTVILAFTPFQGFQHQHTGWPLQSISRE